MELWLVHVRAHVPRVIPLGHWMSEATRTRRSAPFMPDFSILAGSPQSDQYRNLQDRGVGTHTFRELQAPPPKRGRGRPRTQT